MTLPVIVIGSGGHAGVVADTLRACGVAVLGFTDRDAARHGTRLLDYPVLGDDGVLAGHRADQVMLANGIGSVGPVHLRREVYARLSGRGYRFATLVHPSAIVAPSAELGPGAQIMAGAILQPNVVVGENTIVNSGAIVDHDCQLGAHCHIGPGSTLSGGVQIGDGTHVGTAAALIQQVRVGDGVLIAAGAVVIGDVAAQGRVMGVPARETSV